MSDFAMADATKGGVERILQTLVVFSEMTGPVTARQLAERTGLPTTTLYRQLQLLRQFGFVTDLGREAGFVAGPVCLRLGAAAEGDGLLERIAPEEMRLLAKATDETVALMLPARQHVICAETVESSLSLRCSVTRGALFPLGKGASTLAILAHLSASAQKAALGEAGPEAAHRLRQRLEDIRRQGYATSEGELDEGVWGVSAPVFGPGRLAGGLSLMAPATRAAGRQDNLIQLTAEAAARLSARLQKRTAQGDA